MTAHIVIDLTVTDVDKLQKYSALAAQTLIPFGGEFLSKGPIDVLHGESAFTTKVIIEFPDKDNAVNWYGSTEYQAIINIRNEAIASQFHLIG